MRFVLQVTEETASWIGSLMPLSALAGGVAGGPLLETLGRKRAILHTAVPFILASLAVAYAGDVTTV